MPTNPAFWGENGQPIALGDEVCIRFVVAGCTYYDKFGKKLPHPRVTLELKYDLNNQELVFDGRNKPVGYAPGCVITKY